MNMFLTGSQWLYTHTHTRTHTHIHTHINIYPCIQPCHSVVQWIVGHFVALWEILSLESVAQLIPLLPDFSFFLLNFAPIGSAASFTCQSKALAPPQHPSLTPPFPQLHRKTHYLLEDKSQCQSLLSSPLLSSMPKTPPSSLLLLFSHLLKKGDEGMREERKRGSFWDTSHSSWVLSFNPGCSSLLWLIQLAFPFCSLSLLGKEA